MEQTKGLKRNTKDKYYTKPEIALQCINLIKSKRIISKHDIIIEPSAGNGSFFEGIKKLSKNYLLYDIEPQHKDIIQQDYLTMELDDTNKYHVIGNNTVGPKSISKQELIAKFNQILFLN